MPISFQPMRDYMKAHGISYYYLANAGIDAKILQRIRQDLPVTTKTLGYICRIMKCQPGDLIEYIDSTDDDRFKQRK